MEIVYNEPKLSFTFSSVPLLDCDINLPVHFCCYSLAFDKDSQLLLSSQDQDIPDSMDVRLLSYTYRGNI